ncbi:MAG: DUF2851 family protein [Bacteroidales bacterium]
MPEEFIVFLWKYRLLEQSLTLTSGESCTILETGSRNDHSGPDFLNARIRIGDTIWAGNVEVHVNASDWYRHDHHKDVNYDNIILHVVYLEDKTVRRKSGEVIPTLEIHGRYDEGLFNRYLALIKNRYWIPCQPLIDSVERVIMNHWLDRMLVERLETRTSEIMNKLEFNKGDWSETFYQLLARNFGFRVNALPFELLACSLPLKTLSRHKNDLFQIEALLFGQAGLLGKKYKDPYLTDLQKEYIFLAGKYDLQPVDGQLWKFMRLRPSNFPTIRLSQFAALIFNSSHLFSKILETKTMDQFTTLFASEVSSYWFDHYIFDKRSPARSKKMGAHAIHLLLMNTVAPFLFSYGKFKNKPALADKALKLLEGIPGETNTEIRKWKEMGFQVRTAFNTQALLELKRSYCALRKCLDCAIGLQLVRGS